MARVVRVMHQSVCSEHQDVQSVEHRALVLLTKKHDRSYYCFVMRKGQATRAMVLDHAFSLA
ncbi:MAG: hypothetical protein OES32_12260, partial [Acidobacteriota bacterium]|nr:hypothetical protein [Acidobacteriota bacterium]